MEKHYFYENIWPKTENSNIFHRISNLLLDIVHLIKFRNPFSLYNSIFWMKILFSAEHHLCPWYSFRKPDKIFGTMMSRKGMSSSTWICIHLFFCQRWGRKPYGLQFQLSQWIHYFRVTSSFFPNTDRNFQCLKNELRELRCTRLQKTEIFANFLHS